MANTNLFASAKGTLPRTDAVNEAGGRAYALPPKQALAHLAATGCFHGTFYASGEAQLDRLKALVDAVDDPVFLAKLAVYAREKAFMKDMPAALLVLLSKRDTTLMHKVFGRVVDNGRMLRTAFQLIRSGQLGRTCLSSSLLRAFGRWLNEASVGALLSASIGNDPSLRDVLRMARPLPKDNTRRALFGWLVGKEVARWAPAAEADLPEAVRLLEQYRRAGSEAEQAELVGRMNIRWDLLADAAKGPKTWEAIARTMGPQALRMNLNTLQRHGVFDDPAMVEEVARRLADPEEIARSRQFPYQYLAAYMNMGREEPKRRRPNGRGLAGLLGAKAAPGGPEPIREALHRAAEVACGNVPELPGPVVIGLDVSGSMSSPVTGNRGRGGTSAMRCVDVAALFAAAVLRRNPGSVVIPFDTKAYRPEVDPGTPILALAEQLSKYGGGGTDCSLPLVEANARPLRDRRFAGVVLVSDSESWVYGGTPWSFGRRGASGVMDQWQEFVKNQLRLGGAGIPSPKLICINIQPYGTTQAPDRGDILNVAGFSDAVFRVVAAFLDDDAGRFVAEVEAIEL